MSKELARRTVLLGTAGVCFEHFFPQRAKAQETEIIEWSRTRTRPGDTVEGMLRFHGVPESELAKYKRWVKEANGLDNKFTIRADDYYNFPFPAEIITSPFINLHYMIDGLQGCANVIKDRGCFLSWCDKNIYYDCENPYFFSGHSVSVGGDTKEYPFHDLLRAIEGGKDVRMWLLRANGAKGNRWSRVIPNSVQRIRANSEEGIKQMLLRQDYYCSQIGLDTCAVEERDYARIVVLAQLDFSGRDKPPGV